MAMVSVARRTIPQDLRSLSEDGADNASKQKESELATEPASRFTSGSVSNTIARFTSSRTTSASSNRRKNGG